MVIKLHLKNKYTGARLRIVYVYLILYSTFKHAYSVEKFRSFTITYLIVNLLLI
jgi:hypothetical protein